MLWGRRRDPGEPPPRLPPAASSTAVPPYTPVCLTALLVQFVSTSLLGDKPAAGAGAFRHATP